MLILLPMQCSCHGCDLALHAAPAEAGMLALNRHVACVLRCRLSALEEAAGSITRAGQEEATRQVAALRAELAAHAGSFHADAGSMQGLRSGLESLRSRASNLQAAIDKAAGDHKMALDLHSRRLTKLEDGGLNSDR